MKKHYALVLAGLLSATGVMAQSGFKRCESAEHLEEQMQQDPSMRTRLESIERFTEKYVKNSANQRTNAIVTIPVVVHVVYKTSAQNVSDAMINAQIDVLNKDFAKLNADANKVPSAFAGLAAATNVRFVLAKRTPTGAATTGIVRKATTKTSFTSNNGVKKSSTGGSTAWDATKYLNIWVCNLGSGLLGYAQFPGGSTATDGVVVLYSSLPGGTAVPYNKGRTATHEVGHYLNLRHIWGDASCGNDLVTDTPTQSTANYGCPAYPHKTCSNNGDLSMNYMDYTDDGCMYMFSTGQSARMDALFAAGGARVGITTSLGGVAPSGAIAASNDENTPEADGSEAYSSSRDMNVAPNMVFPNPVKAEMNVSYNVAAENTGVKVEIYNLMGKLIKTFNEGAKPAGKHIFRLSGEEDATFGSLSNGLYFVRVNGSAEAKTIRFLIER
jgi:hypothetical protein